MMSADGKTITRSVKTYVEVLSLMGGFFLAIYGVVARTYRFFSEDFGLLRAALGLADEARFKTKFSKTEFKIRDITNTFNWSFKYFCFRKLFCCRNTLKDTIFDKDGRDTVDYCENAITDLQYGTSLCRVAHNGKAIRKNGIRIAHHEFEIR
jgi:hypothetical protein